MGILFYAFQVETLSFITGCDKLNIASVRVCWFSPLTLPTETDPKLYFCPKPFSFSPPSAPLAHLIISSFPHQINMWYWIVGLTEFLLLFFCGLFLVAQETHCTCVCCCTPYTIAVLLSILRGRPRWRFPPSANKGPGHPACLCPLLFPSIPPSVHLNPAQTQLSVPQFSASSSRHSLIFYPLFYTHFMCPVRVQVFIWLLAMIERPKKCDFKVRRTCFDWHGLHMSSW